MNDINQNDAQKLIQLEMQINAALRQILTPEAKQRLSNIKLVNRERYYAIAQSLLTLYRAGRITKKLTDEELKALLLNSSSKREINIRRK
ncbi:MAG: DNA-binding protein [Candidatus Iainarchaeum archaeon]|uniref:DNA-binding protein n=1 Tax=Candidatus Iainarchaeum sp. TaxID=3101447 RepID=A0A497JGK9_9ARCH|nr:MAG: DNA-binding protein [Candidatus Diapherotrites archaeon]